jgi:hypothetical protein
MIADKVAILKNGVNQLLDKRGGPNWGLYPRQAAEMLNVTRAIRSITPRLRTVRAP